MKKVDITKILHILNNSYSNHVMEDSYSGNPYKALVSCLLSLRTRDEVTFPIADRLFEVADNPSDMLKLSYENLCSHIKSINYYKTKAENIQLISKILLEKYGGNVPDTIEELLTLRGVGRKTANIVIGVGFNKPSIAVDTHVHRITNRLGYVKTNKPDQTEVELRAKLPKSLWKIINRVLVLHGKAVCKPITPLCGKCPVEEYCMKILF